MFSKLLVTLPFVLGAFAGQFGHLAGRASSATTDFTMYAYGASDDITIGGYQVVYKDGLAYIASTAAVTGTQNVTFDLVSSQFVTTTEDNEDSFFYLPTTSGEVGFTTTTTNSSQITTGFAFYGHTAYCAIGNTMATRWFAVPTDDADLWQLTWKSEADSAVLVALRNIAPSN
ncbi:hypothetical protein BX600DRAFT_554081 [Xylariales sp. PMI_506]|nr:hypothetical protein BX600DRAFT_554081 [Xylariales sp. PMI_506]